MAANTTEPDELLNLAAWVLFFLGLVAGWLPMPWFWAGPALVGCSIVCDLRYLLQKRRARRDE